MKNLEEIADHCTMCGKCLQPCPVNIDTAEVSLLERSILSELGYKNTAPATRLSLAFLKSRNKYFNSAFRKGVLEWGSAIQQLGSKMLKKVPDKVQEKEWQYITMLKSPMMTAPATTLWHNFPDCSSNEALMLKPEGEPVKTVFYFPGCGSERLYSDISMAAIYIMLKNRIRVILPPPYLCCGFPAEVNAKAKMHDEMTLRNTIVLSQIRDMLGYIVFDRFIISCGTCRESLQEIGVEEIFECGVEDVSSYVQAIEGFEQNGPVVEHIMYHAPCHDSLDGDGALAARQLAKEVIVVPNCCSEAGTLAVSRPDISYKMMQRKRDALLEAKERVGDGNVTIVTNCPSCISGLGRNRELGVTPQHMAVMLAQAIGTEKWISDFQQLLVDRVEKVTF